MLYVIICNVTIYNSPEIIICFEVTTEGNTIVEDPSASKRKK